MEFKQIQGEMIAAMKSGDKVRKNAVSNLIAAIKKVAIDNGTRDNITEELVNQVVLKELKSIKEQIDSCPDERAELKQEYQTNYDIISEFTPKQLDENEIREIITSKFADLIKSGNKGMIMKAVMGELKGKAEGKLINSVVASLCE